MPKKLSFAGRRMLALAKGKENIDDLEDGEKFTIYCVGRDLTIHCGKGDLSWWFENANYKPTHIIIPTTKIINGD